MNTLVICNPCLQDVIHDGLFCKWSMDGEEFTVALLDFPEPDISEFFQTNSVVVKVSAFSCNYRDRSLMHQFYQQCKDLSGRRKYFYSPIGSEFVGEVIRIGEDVTSLNIGDRVIADNSYPFKTNGALGGIASNFVSQRLLILPSFCLTKIPDCMSDEMAAGFSLSAQTSYSMIRKANIKEGDNILVTAITSNTSLAILEKLKHYKVNVFGCSSKAFLLEKYADELGLKEIFQFDEKLPILDEDSSLKFDVIFDPFIDLYFDKLSDYLNYNARYVFCGFYQQHSSYKKMTVSENLLSMFDTCIYCNLSLIGNCIGCNDDLQNALQDFCDGTYVVHIDSVYRGEQITDFLQKSFLENRIGKVIYKYVD